MNGRVLIIAGSDSGGGAGIQADLKTVTALKGYGMTAIAALTAQNTLGVHGIWPVPAAFVRLQMEVVLADMGADALKTGMLSSVEMVHTVADTITQCATGIPLVVDPVMVAKGGARLLDEAATTAMIDRLFPLATLITPNLPEAEALLDHAITDVETMKAAACDLLSLGPKAVLLKGGHLEGDILTDVLADHDHGVRLFTGSRIHTTATHGTGCSLASAIATGLAQGLSLTDAVTRARAYVREAIFTTQPFGHGHGPINHSHTVREFIG